MSNLTGLFYFVPNLLCEIVVNVYFVVNHKYKYTNLIKGVLYCKDFNSCFKLFTNS